MQINGKFLKSLREQLYLSQESLSQATRISTFRIGKFERGYKPLTSDEITRIEDFIQRRASELGKIKVEAE